MGILKFLKKPAAGSEGTIRVEFIDGADHSIIAVSEMLPAQLPDTFAINTTLDIKDQKWSVFSAEPMEKTQFLKTGKLRLVLSHLTLANPADVLFSLPTISCLVSLACELALKELGPDEVRGKLGRLRMRMTLCLTPCWMPSSARLFATSARR